MVYLDESAKQLVSPSTFYCFVIISLNDLNKRRSAEDRPHNFQNHAGSETSTSWTITWCSPGLLVGHSTCIKGLVAYSMCLLWRRFECFTLAYIMSACFRLYSKSRHNICIMGLQLPLQCSYLCVILHCRTSTIDAQNVFIATCKWKWHHSAICSGWRSCYQRGSDAAGKGFKFFSLFFLKATRKRSGLLELRRMYLTVM